MSRMLRLQSMDELHKLTAKQGKPTAASSITQARERTLALGRLPTGHMNATEQRYSQHLDDLRTAGAVVWWLFEGVKLRLADNTFYTPDFAVMTSFGHIEMHEVKGYWHDDARVKIKVAAALFPFRFIAVMAQKKKDGGGFAIEEF